MSVTNLAEWDSRTDAGAESAAAVEATEAMLAIDEFVADVLRRANQTVEPLRSPGEHRTILRVAHLFADDLMRRKYPFDRVQFIETVMGGDRDA
jgi:hypothetical protein